MFRKAMIAVIACSALGATVPSKAAWGVPTALLVPASTAFSVLGHSCGGIQEQVLATGFDATSGYPTGAVYLQTRCGGSGRGGGYHTTTYSAWLGVTWDYAAAVFASQVLAGAPAGLDPSFSAVDSFGNEIENTLNAVNVPPSGCTVGNTTYCTYRAYLLLAAGFVPPPRVTSVSTTFGPATGGTSVMITGTGFTGAIAVSFGDAAAASFAVSADTSITAVSPATSAGTVDIMVTTAGGTSPASASDQFTFIAAPVVTGISPDSGQIQGGTTVTITGSGFADALEVDFGATPAGFTVNDDSSITAVSPPAEEADTVHVGVTTAGGTSVTAAADRFTYEEGSPTGCGGACPASVQCARLRGTLEGTMTVSSCTPRSAVNRRASLDLATTTWTWKPSGETTIASLDATSPGQGDCRAGSIEYDLSGTVVDGTSTSTAVGDPVSARICVSPAGRLSLVKGTLFGL